MPAQRRWLVFSSVGDRSEFPRYWLDEHEQRQFDIWVCYYGEREDAPFKPFVDRHFQHKGHKFQNFQWVFEQHREIIEAIFMPDGDILISTREINELFHIRESYDLAILQPAFAPNSRLYHGCTARIPGAFLHYTNFVENSSFKNIILPRILALKTSGRIDFFRFPISTPSTRH